MTTCQTGLKTDLHLHTCDGPQEPYIGYNALQLIDAAAEQGYEVLSITNHDTVTFSDYLKDYAAERGILLIPGIELTVRQKHVLGYRIDGKLGPIHDVGDIHKEKDEDTLFIAPHPFFPHSASLGKLFLRQPTLFDAVELSHFYTSLVDFNTKARSIAHDHDLPLVGTSDSHSLSQLGTTYSIIRAEKDPESIFRAVKQGRLDIVTQPLSHIQAGLISHELFFSHSVKKIGMCCLYLLSLLLRN
ncbi:MAG: PHP domain-containing protein [Deltaproteobacteria bacterium]|nr:PHP domain-containing protein [Deltaproteobacteria bacterium]